jgi:LysR family nitrogen assimilation transcriptional regulator
MVPGMAGFLDIRRLRYFKAIADHGSLSAAARALNLAQPALSHHVTQLESQIGTPLLNRRHDGVGLTEAGKLLLRHATDIVARTERAEMELSRMGRDQGAKVKIRLAVISSLAADLTPILVAALSTQMPEVVLRITESGTLDSRELLERGEADLAVYLAAAGEGSEAPLAMERLYLVTAGNGDQASAPISFAEVTEQRLVLPALGNPLRSFVESAAARAGRSLDVALEVDGAGPRRNAILAGLGSTILGAHSVHGAERRAGIIARPIVEPTLFRPIFFGARRGLDPALVARIRAVLAKSLADFGGMEVAAGAIDAAI